MMVIELSGEHFGLKSSRDFACEFDLRSEVWFQTKIARHEVKKSLYYSHFEIGEFNPSQQ